MQKRVVDGMGLEPIRQPGDQPVLAPCAARETVGLGAHRLVGPT